MADKLKAYFEKAEKLGGKKAQMRLSMITKMSIVKAGEEEDSPENIKLFDEAIKEIEKEFN